MKKRRFAMFLAALVIAVSTITAVGIYAKTTQLANTFTTCGPVDPPPWGQ